MLLMSLYHILDLIIHSLCIPQPVTYNSIAQRLQSNHWSLVQSFTASTIIIISGDHKPGGVLSLTRHLQPGVFIMKTPQAAILNNCMIDQLSSATNYVGVPLVSTQGCPL